MKHRNILALDIGRRRTGVARANMIARLPEPLRALDNDEQLASKLQVLVAEHDIDLIVVGLPRDVHGAETAQSAYSRELAEQLHKALGVPVSMVDETLSSVKAEELLTHYKGHFSKADVDSKAATLILQAYLDEA